MRTLLAVLLLAVPVTPAHAAGPTSDESTPSVARAPLGNCVTAKEYQLAEPSIRAHSRALTHQALHLLYADPVGGGGTQSFGKTINNYVDLDPSPGPVLDPYCGTITYDGHNGHDILIANFYDMDEGVPILAAAPGIVVYSHDGEFDRWTVRDASHIANAVIIQNDADGSLAYYWHMRTGSVRVQVSDAVSVGDTLGLIGSSGDSNWPHLHFETQYGGTIEPDNGPCQANPTWWISQPTYTPNTSFECYASGVTTILPVDQTLALEKPPSKSHVKYPATLNGWIFVRNIKFTDTFTWAWFKNGIASGSTTIQLSPAGTSWFSIQKTITNSSTNVGNWRLDLSRNGTLYAQHNFTINANVNQLPTIAPQTFELLQDQTLYGQFTGIDPDGVNGVFWYIVDSGPFNGTLVQDGGRKRKFRYVPNSGYVGRDSVMVHAVDDENAVGATSQYTFNVKINPAASVPEPLATNSSGVRLYASPNPMTHGGELSYRLTAASRVRLTLHDVTGRVIRVLEDGDRGAGDHRLTWDGRDAGGHTVTAGVYFARLNAGLASDSRRLALVP